MPGPPKLFLYLAHTTEPLAELVEWLATLPEDAAVAVKLSEATDDTPVVVFVAV